MILMSRYMGQLHGGRGSKNLGKALPPSFRAMPARKRFFSCEVFPNSFGLYWTWACPPVPASQKIMVNKQVFPLPMIQCLRQLQSGVFPIGHRTAVRWESRALPACCWCRTGSNKNLFHFCLQL